MSSTPIIPSESVYLGSGTEQVSVALQHVQRIYREITGKSDVLSKDYDVAFRIEADDINQLNSRIKQALEQYSVTAGNCAVNVFFADDTRQQFGSFDAFAELNAASTSCVSSVEIKYNVLIVQPLTKVVQTFELSVRLLSRVAMEKQMREVGPILPKEFRTFVIGTTAEISVKHVDYTIARTLLDIADRWLSSCKNAKRPKWIDFLRRNSRTIAISIHYLVGLVVALVVLYQLPEYLKQDAGALTQVSVTLASIFAAFGMYRIAFHLSRKVEDALDSHNPISYVKLTRGDAAEIEQAEAAHAHNWRKGTVAFGAAILEAAFAKYIVAIVLAFSSVK